MTSSYTMKEAPFAALLDRSVCEMTERVAGLELKASDFVIHNSSEWESFVIQTKGDYMANLVMSAEESVFKEIASRMKRGGEVSKKDIVEYVTEYYNIVCGYFISHLNKLLHVKARFGIPVLKKGISIRKRLEGHVLCLRYVSQFGRMQFYAEGLPFTMYTMKEKV